MIIYTDGACKENSRDDSGNAYGKGGWAFLILDQVPGQDMEVVMRGSDFKDGTTNQEMEIIAVAEALETLRANNSNLEKTILYSDSAYVINCLKDKWYLKWKSNGWLNSKKNPVENRESWERVIEAIDGLNVEFFHVKRNTTRYIREVDSMAKKASKPKSTPELL